MADISITSEIKTAQVTKGVKVINNEVAKVGKAVGKLDSKASTMANRSLENARRVSKFQSERAYGKMGKRRGSAMGLLEVSRGVEDFAVSGMRGALNNIPGTLMSLGAGAGLAGAASLAAVGVMQLTKVLESYLDKMREVKEATMMVGFSVRSLAKEYTAAAESARDMADITREIIGDAKASFAESDARQDTRRRIRESNMAVANAKELALLKREGYTQEEAQLRQLHKQNELLLRQDEERAEKLSSVENYAERIKSITEGARKEAERGKNAETRLKELLEEEEALRAKIAKDTRLAGETMKDSSYINQQVEALRNVRRAENEQVAFDIRTGIEAEKKLEILEKELNAAERKAKLARIEDTANKEKIRDQIKLLQVRKFELETEKMLALERGRQTVMSAHAIRSGGLLSSLGSKGMGATEATNSMNLQKQQVTLLKDINRSLKKKLITSYN